MRLLADNEHQKMGPFGAIDSTAPKGMYGVVEDGMVGKWCEISRESRLGTELAFMTREGPKNRRWAAVRAFVVAMKRGNARGAKERRKMEAR